MRERVTPSLVVSILALVITMSGIADAARHTLEHALAGRHTHRHSNTHRHTPKRIDGHRVSAVPYPGGVLLLGKTGRFPAKAIPVVGNASQIDGKSRSELEPSCPPAAVDMGTWCLERGPHPLQLNEKGFNNWFWASQKCVEEGGFLPSTAQLIGAAKQVLLEGKIHENMETATLDTEPLGLKDEREMSSTLVTTTGGSEAAGSYTEPAPASAQYVTVYSNEQKGGLAGGEPVSAPESFRCGYFKAPRANKAIEPVPPTTQLPR
ncbi:MAG: hypothetical protein FWD42_10285 [Solirubrobacterales bacterium]|nr:hypothetical protein [Solirubrobacterales bacterium]